MALKRICNEPGCCETLEYSSPHRYCEKHRFRESQKRARNIEALSQANHNQWQHLYALKEWQELRREQLQKQPNCERCGYPATEVHHIQPHNGDKLLFLDPYNLASLCHKCHYIETRREMQERKANKKKQDSRKLWY